MKVFCKDCKCWQYHKKTGLWGCYLNRKWYFEGLNRFNECAYHEFETDYLMKLVEQDSRVEEEPVESSDEYQYCPFCGKKLK